MRGRGQQYLVFSAHIVSYPIVCVCVCVQIWCVCILSMFMCCIITSTTGHLIRDAVPAVDPSSTFFVRRVVLRRALHEDQLVVADDECGKRTLDYANTCPGSLVTVSDKF